MLGQQIVERGAEPCQATAQIERIDLKWQHRVIDRNRRRRRGRSSMRGLDVERF